MDVLGVVVLAILAVVLFFASREVLCWYYKINACLYKINDCLKEQEKTNDLLLSIYVLLEEMANKGEQKTNNSDQ